MLGKVEGDYKRWKNSTKSGRVGSYVNDMFISGSSA